MSLSSRSISLAATPENKAETREDRFGLAMLIASALISVAISFVSPEDYSALRSLERFTGRGLLRGLKMTKDPMPLRASLAERGLLVGTAGDNVLRLAPLGAFAVLAVDANQRSVDLAEELYKKGLTDFLTVLDAQRNLFASQDSLVKSERALADDVIVLYKALGGGWETFETPPATDDETDREPTAIR